MSYQVCEVLVALNHPLSQVDPMRTRAMSKMCKFLVFAVKKYGTDRHKEFEAEILIQTQYSRTQLVNSLAYQ